MPTFEATIRDGAGGGAYVEVPDDVVAALGGKGRIAVTAAFDGVPYQGSVVSMGDGKVLGMLKGIRQQLGKAPGDTVSVTVELDTQPRVVTVPDDLAAALRDAGLNDVFEQLSHSHRREYVSWIDEAKRAVTRGRRVGQTVERLRAGDPRAGVGE